MKGQFAMKIEMSLDEISAGSILEQDIFDFYGHLLLSKGQLLNHDMIESLKKRNLRHVYIYRDNDASDYEQVAEPASSPNYSEKTEFAGIYNNALNFVDGFIRDIKRRKEIDIEAVAETVSTFTSGIFSDYSVLAQMRKMKAKDDYLITHSIDVSLLAITIGKWLGYNHGTVHKLGIAGLLHDLGKVHIPDEILKKPASLTERERRIMNSHPVIGYQMCKTVKNLDKSIPFAILMHHERMDGSGYPASIKSEDISAFAAILAIADTYDAITSRRVYSSKRTPYKAAEEILREAMAGRIDSCIGKIFYDRLLSLAIGNMVLLSNNDKGEVIFMNPLKPNYPIVKVNGQVYNLEKEKENGLSIVDVL
ncbi:MAG: HD-GYP domain-containing protein [Syntrophomonas sp.]|nr:HD-GYP domain-containing protein [Syntrophomonas sp.]